MFKTLLAAALLFSLESKASTGYFLLKDKKAGLRINQELAFFLDFEASFLANKYNLQHTQSLLFYFPNETRLGLSVEFDSKIKQRDMDYNYFLSLETKLW